MAKKRVLIFSTAYLPMVGGAEVAIKEITERLGDKYEFELLTAKLKSSLDSSERIGGVLVHRFGFGSNLDKLLVAFLGVFKVMLLSREGKFDLFWSVQASYASGPAYIYNIINYWRKVPIVLTLQEGDSEEHLTKRHFGLIDLSWRMALARSTYLTAISNYLYKRAQGLGYKGIGKVIPNAVDINKFGKKISKREQDQMRERLGLSKSDFVIITTSRLVLKNGVGDIIKTLAYLPPEVKFLCLGSGPLEMELKNLTASYKLSERVIWQGFVPNDDLVVYLALSDVFIRPSLSEGLGISFLEAMAVGLPVIATLVGGIPDFLKDGVTGLRCEIEDPTSIADCVQRLIISPSLRKELGKNGQSLVNKQYTWDKVVRDMAEVFMSVIAK